MLAPALTQEKPNMESKHWQKIDELLAANNYPEAARLQAAYESQWFERAKAGEMMNLTELIGGAETVHIAALDREKSDTVCPIDVIDGRSSFPK
jgi:hypothetical protein